MKWIKDLIIFLKGTKNTFLDVFFLVPYVSRNRMLWFYTTSLQGQFVGVVGKVGSGKSSLLNAILAEMHRVGGQISIGNQEEGFALVSQEAWIQQCTIRDNILFGRQYDHRRYEKVLEAAALSQDLAVSLFFQSSISSCVPRPHTIKKCHFVKPCTLASLVFFWLLQYC